MICPLQTFRQLKKEGQLQLLEWYPTLSEAKQKELLDDIARLDFDMIRKAGAAGAEEAKGVISPMPVMKQEEIASRRDDFEALGVRALSDGKLACVILAGGQGSRLGFEHAKGMYNLAYSGELYLFQILIENLRDNAAKAGRPIALYIMTSELNHEETVEFFKEKDFFGYPADMIRFFRQDMAPSLSPEGKVLLEEKQRISFTPNGNGGWFSSLQRNGMLAEMKAAGIEWLNVFSVDNVLQQIADPVFLGAVLAEGAFCGAKVIAKASPEEKVGAICLKDGKPSVVEYSELSEEMRYAKNEAGDYLYYYGVTLNYLFHIEATEARAGASLSLHKAFKKIRSLDASGNSVMPDAPNAYKIETFIFDILECYPAVTAFEVIREDEFAPIKNAAGNDSPDSARALLAAKRPEWTSYLTKEKQNEGSNGI